MQVGVTEVVLAVNYKPEEMMSALKDIESQVRRRAGLFVMYWEDHGLFVDLCHFHNHDHAVQCQNHCFARN